MVDKERVSIYIDGGNFHYLVLKKLAVQEANFDFENFANFLANGREITGAGKRFYVGTVRELVENKRSKEVMSKQTSLFTILKSHNWEIKTSKLRIRMEKVVIDERVVGHEDLLKKGVTQIEFRRMREKGIDVKLATDLITGAMDNRYDVAVVVSSDADLVPAIDCVRRRFKKKIEYIGFSIMDKFGNETNNARPLQTLISYSDVQRILVESDLKPFLSPFSQKELF